MHFFSRQQLEAHNRKIIEEFKKSLWVKKDRLEYAPSKPGRVFYDSMTQDIFGDWERLLRYETPKVYFGNYYLDLDTIGFPETNDL